MLTSTEGLLTPDKDERAHIALITAMCIPVGKAWPGLSA
jgi:hypothetical protein